jgi:hypothetical protein
MNLNITNAFYHFGRPGGFKGKLKIIFEECPNKH